MRAGQRGAHLTIQEEPEKANSRAKQHELHGQQLADEGELEPSINQEKTAALRGHDGLSVTGLTELAMLVAHGQMVRRIARLTTKNGVKQAL
jgi:hypothetical protein